MIMEQYDINKPKTHLSSLVEKAEEEKPPVTADPNTLPAKSARVGFVKGSISVPADFDRMGGDEILNLFEEVLS